jgi:F-type H+-transporting ATPase subunit delta
MLKGVVAKRYARAVYEIALEQDSLDQWMDDLKSIQVFFQQPEVAAYLSDVKLQFENKKTLISRALQGLRPVALNLAYLLVSRGRIDVIGEVVTEYEKLVNQQRGIEVVEVKTAVPLDEEEKKRLSDRLAAITGKKVILQIGVDPDIIGGLVAKIGDKVIDGSTKAKLIALKAKLAGAG